VSTVSFVASVLLGIAFVVAGGSKLAAGAAWAGQASALGAPRFAAPILPWIEIGVGAALIAQLAEPFAAVAAIAMLFGFTGLIAARLAEGERPPCACFGAWSATPIGPWHLARNFGLMMVGMLALYP
jgi:uncharacterized membrane protein YphA (DoxX/SURF4 family)